MSIKDIRCKIATNIAAAVTMIGMTVVAKVGYDFFTIKVLPTAAQFGAKCGSALMQNGLVFGASAGIALAIDLIADKVIEKISARRESASEKAAIETKGYFIKRAITVVAVIGFTLIAGASPIVPIVTLIVLIAKDLLGKAIDCSKAGSKETIPEGTKTEEIVPKEMTEEEKFNQIQTKFNQIEIKLVTKLTAKERALLCYFVALLMKSVKEQKLNAPLLENESLQNDNKKRIETSNRLIIKMKNNTYKNLDKVTFRNIDELEENVFEERLNQILQLDLNAPYLYNFKFKN